MKEVMMLKNEETEKPRYVVALALLVFYGFLVLFMVCGMSRILGIV
jgi:hypothetical protein